MRPPSLRHRESHIALGGRAPENTRRVVARRYPAHAMRASSHDSGGALGGVPYFHPVHRPGPAYWRPIDKNARRLHRLGIATEDVSALISVVNGQSDASQVVAVKKALVVAAYSLLDSVKQFHQWFQSAGSRWQSVEAVEREQALYDLTRADDLHKGALKHVRNKIGAHMDWSLDEEEFLSTYRDLEALMSTLPDQLAPTVEYVNFVVSLRTGQWAREDGDSIHICQKDLPPLTIAEEKPYKPDEVSDE